MIAVELALCRKLRKPQIIKEIEDNILGEENIYEVARKNGWNHDNKKDAEETIGTSCQTATKRFIELGRTFTAQYVDNIINNQLIPQMTRSGENRQIWTRAINNTDFEALKFLNAIAASASGNPGTAAHLTSALNLKENGIDLPAHHHYD